MKKHLTVDARMIINLMEKENVKHFAKFIEAQKIVKKNAKEHLDE